MSFDPKGQERSKGQEELHKDGEEIIRVVDQADIQNFIHDVLSPVVIENIGVIVREHIFVIYSIGVIVLEVIVRHGAFSISEEADMELSVLVVWDVAESLEFLPLAVIGSQSRKSFFLRVSATVLFETMFALVFDNG